MWKLYYYYLLSVNNLFTLDSIFPQPLWEFSFVSLLYHYLFYTPVLFCFSSVHYILSSFPLLWLPVSAPPYTCVSLPPHAFLFSLPVFLLPLREHTSWTFWVTLLSVFALYWSLWLEGSLHAHCCPPDCSVGPCTVSDRLMLKHGTVKLGREGSLRTSCLWGDSSCQDWRTLPQA